MARGLRLDEAQFRALQARKGTKATGTPAEPVAPASGPPARPTRKYRNTPTGGYASKAEAARAVELRTLQAAGVIRNLREQVPFELIPAQEGERACTYVADFCYDENDGARWRPIVEDVKGRSTQAYIIKRKMMLWQRGIRIRET